MKAISLDLAAVRQKVDQITAGQEKMARDFTKLQAAEQGILDKISTPSQQPAAALARKPVTPPSQAPPGR